MTLYFLGGWLLQLHCASHPRHTSSHTRCTSLHPRYTSSHPSHIVTPPLHIATPPSHFVTPVTNCCTPLHPWHAASFLGATLLTHLEFAVCCIPATLWYLQFSLLHSGRVCFVRRFAGHGGTTNLCILSHNCDVYVHKCELEREDSKSFIR